MSKIDYNPGDLLFVNENNISRFSILNFFIGKPFIYLHPYVKSNGQVVDNIDTLLFPDGRISTSNITYFKKL